MEEAAQYEEYTKEELIQIIVDLKQTIGDLKKEIEALKPAVSKDSTNSSIPSSKDRIRRGSCFLSLWLRSVAFSNMMILSPLSILPSQVLASPSHTPLDQRLSCHRQRS